MLDNKNCLSPDSGGDDLYNDRSTERGSIKKILLKVGAITIPLVIGIAGHVCDVEIVKQIEQTITDNRGLIGALVLMACFGVRMKLVHSIQKKNLDLEIKPEARNIVAFENISSLVAATAVSLEVGLQSMSDSSVGKIVLPATITACSAYIISKIKEVLFVRKNGSVFQPRSYVGNEDTRPSTKIGTRKPHRRPSAEGTGRDFNGSGGVQEVMDILKVNRGMI